MLTHTSPPPPPPHTQQHTPAALLGVPVAASTGGLCAPVQAGADERLADSKGHLRIAIIGLIGAAIAYQVALRVESRRRQCATPGHTGTNHSSGKDKTCSHTSASLHSLTHCKAAGKECSCAAANACTPLSRPVNNIQSKQATQGGGAHTPTQQLEDSLTSEKAALNASTHLDVDVWLHAPPVAFDNLARQHWHIDAGIALTYSRHSTARKSELCHRC